MKPTKQHENTTYVVWADDTFCLLEEFVPEEWSFLSDDYKIKPALYYEVDGTPVFSDKSQEQ